MSHLLSSTDETTVSSQMLIDPNRVIVEYHRLCVMKGKHFLPTDESHRR